MTVPDAVSIVGGGPAGSYTAYVAKKVNPDLDITIYDARRVIGNPVNCAGAIVSFWLDKLNLKLPDHVVKQTLRGLRIVGPDGSVWEHHQDDLGEDRDVGYVMDRQAFDQWNLDRAMKAGVEVTLGENPQKWDNPYDFGEADYIIGADGWKSSLGDHHGFDVQVADHDMHVGYEHRVIAPDYDQDYISFYLGDKWCPEGYVWVFPEGGNVVKVGLGVPMTYRKDLKKYLRNWLDDYPEFDGERTETIASGSGRIPTSKPLPSFTKQINGSGIALVGDAARQVDPLHGGGIATAMLSAELLGMVIAKGEKVSKYDQLWDARYRPEHLRRYAMKEALTQWGNPELCRMVNALKSFSFNTSDAPVEAARMIVHVMKKEPKMFGRAAIGMLRAFATAKY